MEHEPYYAHKELMAELGLTTRKLPSELKDNVIKFNQKKRFARNPDLIAELQNFSELIAGEIQAWHMANGEPISEPIVEEEPIIEEEPIVEEESEPIIEEEPEPIVEEKPEPIMEKKPDPIVEKAPEPKEEKANGGWGIDTGGW